MDGDQLPGRKEISWRGSRRCVSKTITESKNRIKVMYNHGRDPQISEKPLGSIEEPARGPTRGLASGRLFDTASYVRDLLPALRARTFGSSFRGRVVKSDLRVRPPRSAHNPEGLPEQTIREFRLIEFGPVSFPRYEGATAGMRSMTDYFMPPISKNEAKPPLEVPDDQPVPDDKPSWFLDVKRAAELCVRLKPQQVAAHLRGLRSSSP